MSMTSPKGLSTAFVALHTGVVLTGIVTTLLGPILPILIARWALSDKQAGVFFTAQFCGSVIGVASMSPLIRRSYRLIFVCGFGLIALGTFGLGLSAYAAAVASVAVFGCGLGQTLSAANLWVAQVAGDRRVAALSIMNLMWGIGAISSAPLVVFASRYISVVVFLEAVAACSAAIAMTFATVNMEAEAASRNKQERNLQEQVEGRRPTARLRVSCSLCALFFLYVGSENSVAGWVASLTKRLHSGNRDLWALAPMFFWGGLILGRGLIPFISRRRTERSLLTYGLILAGAGIFFLLSATTFTGVAICTIVVGLGFAGVFPILVAWLVKAFGESSRTIGSIMFISADLGGATMPWIVGAISTSTHSLRAGLVVPLAGCVGMLLFARMMVEPVSQGASADKSKLPQSY